MNEQIVDFAKWLAQEEWMSVCVENKWVWQCHKLHTPELSGYYTEEQLFEIYKMQKMTAVEWLSEQINKHYSDNQLTNEIEYAKKMENKQLKMCANFWHGSEISTPIFKQYLKKEKPIIEPFDKFKKIKNEQELDM
jgi:uncharacterized protein (DUF2164 family)